MNYLLCLNLDIIIVFMIFAFVCLVVCRIYIRICSWKYEIRALYLAVCVLGILCNVKVKTIRFTSSPFILFLFLIQAMYSIICIFSIPVIRFQFFFYTENQQLLRRLSYKHGRDKPLLGPS